MTRTQLLVLGALVVGGCHDEPGPTPCVVDRFDTGLAPWTAAPGSSITVSNSDGGLAMEVPITADFQTTAVVRRGLDLTDGAFEIELVEGNDPMARISMQIGLQGDTCSAGCSTFWMDGWIYGTRYDPALHRFVRFAHDSQAQTLTLRILGPDREVSFETITETTASFHAAVPSLRVISGERTHPNEVATRIVWDNATAYGPSCAR